MLRFSAAPNLTADARTANIVIDNQRFRVEQAGLPRAPVAVAPARLVFGLWGDKTTGPRSIALWTDKQGLDLKVSSTAKWLKAAQLREKKGGGHTVEVSVDPAALPAGQRHEAALLISASGTDTAPLAVPVIVERANVR
jgi:hypothetical protein